MPKTKRQWDVRDRHTGETRRITLREYDLVGMNRWLRDMEVKRVVEDGERRVATSDQTNKAA